MTRSTPTPNSEVGPTAGPTIDLPAVGTLPEGPSALSDRDDPAFPDPTVDMSQIISGGPPPDGIPAIDDPQFLPVIDNLELLDPGAPVVALEINGDARAYPVIVMIWHEIINDEVGNVPVTVTYCPLCNSAVSYRRVINGVETTFGTSGLLYFSALVMYDRATESLWTHFDGKAVVGVLTGYELEFIPSPLLSWGDFRSIYPDGLVLDSSRTGHNRDYGRNPYFGYDNPDTRPFLFFGPNDDRARAKQRIVGVTRNAETKAFTLAYVSGGEAKASNEVVGGDPMVIFWKAGQASALEASEVADGRDVGSVGVFSAHVAGRVLTFQADGERFVDLETGSTWLITGEAAAGELLGTVLERVQHLDTFWFAWATYRPETILVDVPSG